MTGPPATAAEAAPAASAAAAHHRLRGREETDRRRQPLALTPAGFEAFQSATRLLYGRLGELLADLPRHEAQELTRLLTRVEHVLGGSPPPRRPPPPPPRPPRPKKP